jgi:hypothetical protein
MILLADDGSDDARAAVERIAGLMPAAEVTVAAAVATERRERGFSAAERS